MTLCGWEDIKIRELTNLLKSKFNQHSKWMSDDLQSIIYFLYIIISQFGAYCIHNVLPFLLALQTFQVDLSVSSSTVSRLLWAVCILNTITQLVTLMKSLMKIFFRGRQFHVLSGSCTCLIWLHLCLVQNSGGDCACPIRGRSYSISLWVSQRLREASAKRNTKNNPVMTLHWGDFWLWFRELWSGDALFGWAREVFGKKREKKKRRS